MSEISENYISYDSFPVRLLRINFLALLNMNGSGISSVIFLLYYLLFIQDFDTFHADQWYSWRHYYSGFYSALSWYKTKLSFLAVCLWNSELKVLWKVLYPATIHYGHQTRRRLHSNTWPGEENTKHISVQSVIY